MAYVWSGGTFTANDSFGNVVWAGSLGKFIACSLGVEAATSRVSTSTDGATWSAQTTPNQSSLFVSWDDEASLAIVSGVETVMTSSDAVTWTSRTPPTAAAGFKWKKAAYSPSLGLWAMAGEAAGTNNTSTASIATSPDGITWTTRTTPAVIVSDVAWSPTLGIFVAIGSANTPTGYAISSTDGITWTNRTISARTWGRVLWSPSLAKFIAMSYEMVSTSTNGTSWSEVAAPATSADLYSGMAWAESQGTLLAINSTPQYADTTDLSSWAALAAITSPYGDQSFTPAYLEGAYSPTLNLYVFVCTTGTNTYEFLSVTTGTSDAFWYQSDIPGLETGVDATQIAGASARPKAPRGTIFTSPFSETNPLFGSPGHAVAYNNRLIYASSDYTIGTDLPTIRVWNGTSDYKLASVPKDASGNTPYCITSMANADGAIYLGTWDTGTTPSTVVGRVLKLDPNSGQLTNVGNINTLTGYIPWSLAFVNGELWCGLVRSDISSGRIYRIKPATESSWNLDLILSAYSMALPLCMTTFQGKMWYGTAAAAGTFALLGSRTPLGVYAAGDTGSGGTAKDYNGYYAMTVFNNALYASYWNPDTTEISRIRKFDGSAWSTVFDVTTIADVPIIGLYVFNGVLYAIGVRRSAGTYTSVLATSPDGTTWTNRTGDLPLGTFESVGLCNAFAAIAY